MAKKDAFMDYLAKYTEDKPSKEEMIKLKPECLNVLWGGGACPGYVYSFWAPAGVGKSTITLQAVESILKEVPDKRVVYIDTEKALNPLMIQSFKLDGHLETGRLIRIQTVSDYAELEELVDSINKESEISAIVIDSVSMLVAHTPKDLKVSDVRPGLKSMQASHVLNKLKKLAFEAKIVVILLFHARANINISGYGTQPDTKQEGGFVAEHVPDIITKITKHAQVKDGDSVIGVNIKLECTKNKFTAPFKPQIKKLIFGKGISARIDLIDTCIERNLITQSGAFFKLPDGESVKGRAALYELPPEMMKRLKYIVDNS